MVRLNVGLVAESPDSVEALLAALRFLISNTRLEHGCLRCSTWAESDATVNYFEEWETETDMRRRIRSPGFTSLLTVIESTNQPHRLQFDFVEASRAIDYIAEVREVTTQAFGD